MSAARLVIYGATGYTGDLIAREAVRRGLQPVLAGRNEAAIAALAQELGCEYRIASLDDAGALDDASAVHADTRPLQSDARPAAGSTAEPLTSADPDEA